MRVWLALCLLLVPAAAQAKPSCGSGGPTGQGTATAGPGSFRYSVPASYSGQAIPLLLALHGDEGTPDYIYSVFKGLQGTSGGAYVLAAPKAPYGGGSWYQATSQHESFIDQVIVELLGSYNIDQDRIWITGWSGGATFLGYYAIKRQDILAAVVYHMGGGGGGSYSPPPNSCKIPGRFVIGSADFLYSLARKQHDTMKANGHDVTWIELPGVGHDFQQSTLAGTWSWLQQKTLCDTTTPGSCGPTTPDSGPPLPADARPGAHDSGPPAPIADGGAMPDSGPASPDDPPQINRDNPAHPSLLGGCSHGNRSAPTGSVLLLLGVLGLALRRSRGF